MHIRPETKRHSFSSQRSLFSRAPGYSLIEVALTLPILFVFMMGAIDINRAYQAHNAVREAVRTANRCTWATDGDCLEIATDPTPGPAYFNWTAYEVPDSLYYGYKYRYFGTEHHLLAPVYRIGNFTAQNLASQSYSWNSHQREIARLSFPAEGTLPRVYQSRAPRLNIDRVPGGRPDVTATYINGGGTYQNNLSFTSSGSPSLQWSGTRTGTVTFSISGPTGVNACRRSTNFNSAGPHGVSSTTCSGISHYAANTAEVIISVFGNDGSSEAGSSGVVRMSISGPGLSGSVSLGGRAYSANDDASLCPRVPDLPGAPANIVTQTNCDESEPGFYSGFGRLRYNTNYTLHFEVESNAGDLHWNFETLELYMPRISSGWNSWQNCEGGLRPSQQAQNTGCTAPNGQKAKLTKWKNPGQQPGNYVTADQAFTPLAPTTYSANAIVQISQADCAEVEAFQGTQLPPEQCSNWYQMPSTPASGSYSEGCNEQNLGNSILSIGSEGEAEVNPSAALAECGSPTGEPGWNINTSSLTYTAGPVDLSHVSEVLWERENCADNNPPIPTEVTQYQHHSASIQFESYSEPKYLGVEVDPREAVNSAEYSCSQWGGGFSTGSLTYDHTTTQDEFFEEVHFEHVVGCSEEDWHPVVRNHASGEGLNAAAYFESGRTTQLGESESEQSIVSEVTEAVFNQYVGTACQMEFLPGEPDTVLGRVQGDCEQTYQTAPPALCGESGVVCVQEFAGFCGGDGSSSGSAPQSALQAQAEAYFFARLQSLYPGAELGCEGPNCAKFEAPAGYDPSDPQGLASWQGSFEVPLLSANLLSLLTGEPVSLFGANTVSLSLADMQSRTLEAAHVQ